MATVSDVPDVTEQKMAVGARHRVFLRARGSTAPRPPSPVLWRSRDKSARICISHATCQLLYTVPGIAFITAAARLSRLESLTRRATHGQPMNLHGFWDGVITSSSNLIRLRNEATAL